MMGIEKTPDFKEKELFCSFCGKSNKNVKKLVLGELGVSICNECVELCVQLMKEDVKEKSLMRHLGQLVNPFR